MSDTMRGTAEMIQAVTRPLVTMALTGVLCYGFVVKLVGAEAFLSIVGVAITFWFSQRERSKDAAAAREATEAK